MAMVVAEEPVCASSGAPGAAAGPEGDALGLTSGPGADGLALGAALGEALLVSDPALGGVLTDGVGLTAPAEGEALEGTLTDGEGAAEPPLAAKAGPARATATPAAAAVTAVRRKAGGTSFRFFTVDLHGRVEGAGPRPSPPHDARPPGRLPLFRKNFRTGFRQPVPWATPATNHLVGGGADPPVPGRPADDRLPQGGRALRGERCEHPALGLQPGRAREGGQVGDAAREVGPARYARRASTRPPLPVRVPLSARPPGAGRGGDDHRAAADPAADLAGLREALVGLGDEPPGDAQFGGEDAGGGEPVADGEGAVGDGGAEGHGRTARRGRARGRSAATGHPRPASP
ncbi:hypothetical protein ADK51_14210 [Streptomyces sp. WM6368]|nr:hypothetical protein ADK51_14210 [Streptomyces sp. WM6368]